MAGTLSGFGLQTSYPGQQTAWGLSPYTGQGLQQIPQLLQIVPQQIQQLQYVQQQQLQLLQHLLHVVPQQLHQIQQVIQFVPLQIQQLQQQLQSSQAPFGQATTGARACSAAGARIPFAFSSEFRACSAGETNLPEMTAPSPGISYSGTAVKSVTRALASRAKSMPAITAFAATSEPSVGIRMCLYIISLLLSGPGSGRGVVCW